MLNSYRFMSFTSFHWENKEVDDVYNPCQLLHKPHAMSIGISGDTAASVAPSYTCSSTWILNDVLEKDCTSVGMSLATVLGSIPFPDGSYYVPNYFKPWFYFKQFTIVKGHL